METVDGVLTLRAQFLRFGGVFRAALVGRQLRSRAFRGTFPSWWSDGAYWAGIFEGLPKNKLSMSNYWGPDGSTGAVAVFSA
jgi:hypothetical protein